MTKSAIVIGSGAAGTSAAFRLQQAGVSVRMLEREARVGGRMRTESIDGFKVDCGACIIPEAYKEVLSLIHDAKEETLLGRAGATIAVLRSGTMHYLDIGWMDMAKSMFDTQLLSLGSKLLLGKVGVRVLRMARSLGFENLGEAAPYDTESIKAYAVRSLNQELYDYLLNPTQKLMYLIPADDTSVVDFFWSVKNLMSPVAYYAKGGMAEIPRRICQRFDVQLNAEVVAVTEKGEKVEVQWTDPGGGMREESADLCVIATQPQVAGRIDTGLDNESRDYLTNLRYSRFVNLHLRLREKPAERAVLIMAPDDVDPELAGMLLEHNKAPDRAPLGKGAIGVYFLDGFARRTFQLSDEEVFRLAMEKAERLMPGLGALVEGYHVQRWELGGTYAAPGDYRKLARFVEGLNTKRRVQLAGDYYTLACVNGAVTSGRIAASRLINQYLQDAT